jgi:hypothetical protein
MKLTPESPQTPIRASAPLRDRSKRKSVAVGWASFHFEAKLADNPAADLR